MEGTYVPTRTTPSERLLSAIEIRKYLGISKPTYLDLLRRGLPSIRIGLGGRRTHRRFHLETVIEWLHRADRVAPAEGRP